MTETLPDSVRRTLSGGPQVGSGKWQAASNPDSSRVMVDDSRVTSVGGGFSLINFRGLFTLGTSKPDRPAAEPPATSPVIVWGEEESTRTTSVTLGGLKMKSLWLSKFLSATGAKPERAVAHDFEVVLPKKK